MKREKERGRAAAHHHYPVLSARYPNPTLDTYLVEGEKIFRSYSKCLLAKTAVTTDPPAEPKAFRLRPRWLIGPRPDDRHGAEQTAHFLC